MKDVISEAQLGSLWPRGRQSPGSCEVRGIALGCGGPGQEGDRLGVIWEDWVHRINGNSLLGAGEGGALTPT